MHISLRFTKSQRFSRQCDSPLNFFKRFANKSEIV